MKQYIVVLIVISLLALVILPSFMFFSGYLDWRSHAGYLSPFPVRVLQSPSGLSASMVEENATGDSILYIGLPD